MRNGEEYWDEDTKLYITCWDWAECFCVLPKRDLNNKWLWGNAYLKKITLVDESGNSSWPFKHYLKTEKEVFMFKLKEGT